jgi:hypothetical protein
VEWLVADNDEGDVKTYTQAEVDAIIAEQVAGMKSKTDQLLTETKRAKEALKNYDGVDPIKYRELQAAAETAERNRAAAEGDFKSLEKQLVERHTSELQGRDTKIGKLSKALERRLVDAELTRAIASKKGEPDLLLPYARQFVRVRETDDDFEGFVSDERGNPMVSDGKGTPMDFGSFVEHHLMTKFPRAFEGTGSSGGGAPKSTAGGGGNPKSITAGDNSAFISNLEAIAQGKVDVNAG